MPFVQFPEAELGIYILDALVNTPAAQYEFDLSSWRDPMGNVTLKAKDGRDGDVITFLLQDPRAGMVIKECERLAHDILTQQHSPYLSIGFRDYHGRLISRGLGQHVANILAAKGYKIYVLDRVSDRKK